MSDVLRAAKVALIRKERKLPLPGDVLVQEGQEVAPDTPVAKIALKPGIPWVLPASRLLGIEPGELSQAMLRQVGDKVKTKEVIARVDQGLYGRKELESPVDGTIEDISDRSGRVTVREEFGREDPPVEVDVAYELACRPEDISKHMLRREGQEVKKGQIIAKKGEAQAFFAKTALSPVSGVVSKIDPKTGKVTISRPFKQVIVTAYIRGRVASVLETRGCVVESAGVRLTGVFGFGRETYGTLKVLSKGPDQELTEEMITEECAGAVVVGGSRVTGEAIARAMQVGARGIIAGTASYLNLTSALGARVGVGITGQEEAGITVILTEGFGDLAMRAEVWEALASLQGREASINGATQIRAGAVRPEIIVPMPESLGAAPEPLTFVEELRPGMRVRIVNDPHFGTRGTVLEVPRDPSSLETETVVPVVRIRADDGRIITVARPNVELI